jgi:cytoskeletal protein RodZ
MLDAMKNDALDMNPEPHDTNRLTPRELGRARLEARGRRIRRLRRRVTAVAVAVFVGVFGVMTEQLVTGHDPALAKTATTATTASSASTSTKTSTTASSSTSSPTTSTSTGTASSPTAVTTSQS